MQKLQLPQPKKVAIIGGGPSGIICAKYLLEEGLTPTIYEISNQIGGQWNIENPYSNVWNFMTCYSPSHLTHFSDMLFHTKNTNFFPTPQQVHTYLQAYCEKFSLQNYIELNCKVTKIIKTENNLFQVTYKTIDINNNINTDVEQKTITKKQTKEFNYVVYATGQNKNPKIPRDIKNGIKFFTGLCFHSKFFNQYFPEIKLKRNMQKILIVGNGVSGIEMAQILANLQIDVTISMKTPKYVFPKLIGDKSSEQLLFNYFSTLLIEKNVEKADLYYKKLIEKYVGNYENIKGMDRSQNINIKNISFGQYYNGLIAEGKIKEKPEIIQINGHTITFNDQSKEEYGVIILATGYNFSIDKIEPKLKENLKKEKLNLLYDTFHPEHLDLAFAGFQNLNSSSFTILELQARLIAKAYSKRFKFPQQEKIDQIIKNNSQIQLLSKYTQFPNIKAYKLAKLIGCEPILEKYQEFNNKLLFGPMIPQLFKIDGYGKNKFGIQQYIKALEHYKIKCMDQNFQEEYNQLARQLNQEEKENSDNRQNTDRSQS